MEKRLHGRSMLRSINNNILCHSSNTIDQGSTGIRRRSTILTGPTLLSSTNAFHDNARSSPNLVEKARLHKRTPCYDHRCPTCSMDNEDDNHIYQCEHITRSSWRTSLFENIDAKFHVILDPDLLAIIRIGLRAYFTNCSSDFLERFPDGYSTSPYEALITKQNKIGWDHFVRSKLTKEWKLVQYHFANRYGVVKQSKGGQWIL
jgi:hypothetical protein